MIKNIIFSTMKFGLMLDEQISDYKKYLESLDWDIKTVEDIGKKGSPDIEIIKYAKENNLLFISRNEDAILRAETLDVPYLWISSAFIVKAINRELTKNESSFSIEQIKEKYPKAYEKWTKEEEKKLIERHGQGISIQEIAMMHGRKKGAIRSRLKKLDLIK